jgi:hypothetical protein
MLKNLAVKIYETCQFVRKPSHLTATLHNPLFTPGTDAEHLSASLDWLCRAQDQSGTGGVSAGYSFKRGWMPPYPETTGYIIPTFLAAAKHLSEPQYLERALRMGQWECAEQLPSGAVRGGIGLNAYPVVFNTGQVIFGWLALYRVTDEQQFLDATLKAADWLLKIQDADGAWRRHTYMDIPHAYHTRVAWSLAEVYKTTDQEKYLSAGRRNIVWALDQLEPNGWFNYMGFSLDQAPTTHTIAYTLRGLLETAPYLESPLQERAVTAVRNALTHLIASPNLDQTLLLPATFDTQWHPIANYSCLTGNAQLAIICYKLAAAQSSPSHAQVADQLIYHLQTTQDRQNRNHGIRGGIAGSYPLGGAYVPYAYLNWAAKFFIDALLLKSQNTRPY